MMINVFRFRYYNHKMKFITLIATGLALLPATAVAQAEEPIFELEFKVALFTQKKTTVQFEFQNNDNERLFFTPRYLLLYSSSNDEDPVYDEIGVDSQLVNPNDIYPLTLSANSSTHILGHENAEFSFTFEVARLSAMGTDFTYTTDRYPLPYNEVEICDCMAPVDLVAVHT
ncbi:hypothetical protein BGW36DRAFT_391837 [Talaromyces proteolyticus]|uniref:Uncharacterized protein n=1 Tax=Talaromyces proteolyticus TaxID=1131652 RepID=A0AAD4KET0_9EURO|nr:uncharacterized protein BGW36DRAFT_391837 [Talaromyces proteolyticus]KAH8689143.1 hypothetical protein BGW36DRAFT_391837 [Talaromyces proteolyticus]